MAVIRAFRALRPVLEHVKEIACVPYDVVYESEVRSYIDSNPLSFLKITRAEAEFPPGSDPSREEVFARAKENLQKFIDDELLKKDEQPCIYIYRLSIGDHSQTGVVACCSLDEYETGHIKKHEKTQPDRVQDRTEHMLALSAQTGLIFLAFRNTERIRELIAAATGDKPSYEFQCKEGALHSVWRDPQPEKWVSAFAEVPSLYIADGHHRTESSETVRKILREANTENTGDEDHNYVVAGMYPAEDLRILAYNRIVRDLNGMTEDEFLSKISENFVITEINHKQPRHHGVFCMYLNGKWRRLKFAVDHFRPPDPIDRLDVSILQKYLLEPILGIGDPRTDRRIAFVGGARGTGELERIVDDGTAAAAFSLFPTTMQDLFDVSDAGEIMPPKSTWFDPKLKDGLLVYQF